jgi:hypothetical protein
VVAVVGMAAAGMAMAGMAVAEGGGKCFFGSRHPATQKTQSTPTHQSSAISHE